MNKLKCFVAAAMALAITASVAVAVGCKPENSTSADDSQITEIYNAYVAYAEEMGEEPMSYEEWYADLLENAKGATGATGANGKSAYDIAKENGFDGTVEEWLESLRGPKGDDGASATAPQITIDPRNYNWLIDGVDTGVCSKGQNGDNGQNGVSVTGIYETSEDYYVVEFSDGTIVPLTKDNENVAGELIKLGKHDIKLNAHTGSNDGSKKTYYFYLVVEPDDPSFKGLRIKVYDKNIGIENVEFNREKSNGGSAPKSYTYVKNNDVADGTDDVGSYWSKTVATWDDIKDTTGISSGSVYLKNNILCGYVRLSNTSRSEAVDSSFVIERVTE